MSAEHEHLLRAARKLTEQNVEDENVIIPTLAFAALSENYPTLSEIKDQFAKSISNAQNWSTLELKFSNTFEFFWPERYVDGVLLVRRNLVWVNSHYDPDTGVVKKVEIYVTDRSVKASEVERLYEKALALDNLDHSRSDTGGVGWKIYRGAIRMAVRAEDPDIDPIRRHLIRSPHEQLPFPPPKLVGEMYGTLLGSDAKGKFRGYGFLALEGRSRGGSGGKSPTFLPACLAWYLADRTVVTDPQRQLELTTFLESESIFKAEPESKAVREALWKSVERRSGAIKDVESAILDSAGRNLGARPRDKYF